MVVDFRSTSYFERTETLTAYYNDIKRYNKVMSPEVEKKLFEDLDFIREMKKLISEEYRNKTGRTISQQELREISFRDYGLDLEKEQEIKERIITANQRFVVSVARAFAKNDDLLDIINEGNVGLMEALEEYDSNKGTKFSSFAVYYIRRAINLYKMRDGSLVKKQNISKTYHLIPKARNLFVQRNFRQPTLEELKEFIIENYNVNIKEISDMLDVNVSSIDDVSAFPDDDVNSSNVTRYNTYSSSENLYENVSSNEHNAFLVKGILKSLTPREKVLMTMHYGIGYDREYELAEIAERLGLTTERVRQMKREILKKLKKKKEYLIREVH